MPHVVLAARAHERRLPAPRLAANARRTPLRGPFEEEFQLVCAPEAEAWARSLFTPEIVGRLTGPGKTAFDVEVVESRLFVYSHLRSLSCCDPRTWQWMSETADALYARLENLDDTTTMSDAAGAGSVAAGEPIGLAPPYVPLRRPFPVTAVVALLALAGVWAVGLAA
ncbi:hypothetical protein ACFQZ4_38505 [Catellatospora coxensis]